MGMTEVPPPEQPAHSPAPRSKTTTTIGLSLLVAVLLYVIGASIGKSYGPALFCIPFFVGVVAGALAPRRPYLTTLATLAVALLIAVLTLQEGVVCVLMALPVILPLSIAGAFAG